MEDLTRLGDERVTTMNSNNPRFVVQYNNNSECWVYFHVFVVSADCYIINFFKNTLRANK